MLDVLILALAVMDEENELPVYHRHNSGAALVRRLTEQEAFPGQVRNGHAQVLRRVYTSARRLIEYRGMDEEVGE